MGKGDCTIPEKPQPGGFLKEPKERGGGGAGPARSEGGACVAPGHRSSPQVERGQKRRRALAGPGLHRLHRDEAQKREDEAPDDKPEDEAPTGAVSGI